MIVIRRKDALAQGLKRYFTGKPCIRGHVTERNAKNKKCMACQREEQAKWRDSNRDLFRALARKGARKYRQRNSERWAEVYRTWREVNIVKARTATSNWRAANKDAYAAYQAARRGRLTAKLTPEEKNAIRQIYKECREISEATGILHHVDHVIPLVRGGLHHPSNLQILTAVENLKKGDRA